MKRFIVLIILLSIGIFSASADFADFYHNWSEAFSSFGDPNAGLTIFPTLLIPMGGKYEGMGTAYTAVAWDSGYIEANPAGSSTLEMSELSFFHHSWIADSNIESVIYTVRYNDLGIGFGGKFLYIPFTEYNEWGARESKGYISETIASMNISYNFFSSYHFSGLSLGTTLKAAYRNIPSAIYPDQSAITAMVDIGILTRINLLKYYIARKKNFSIGAVIKNLGLPALDEPLPTVATFGIAYSPLNPLTIAVDFNLPLSFNPEDFPAQHWYFASGVDVAVTNFLSIQSGFQFKGDNPRISIGSSLDLEKVSFVVNYNLDLSGGLNPLDKFSVEAKINLGDRGRLAQQSRVEELYLTGLESYARGELSVAIQYWEKVLEIDPGFLPARENIKTALKALELQKTMQDRMRIGE